MKVDKKPEVIYSIRYYRGALLISYLINIAILCAGSLLSWFKHKRNDISRNRYKNLLEKSLPRAIKREIKAQAMQTLGVKYRKFIKREKRRKREEEIYSLHEKNTNSSNINSNNILYSENSIIFNRFSCVNPDDFLNSPCNIDG